MVEENKNNQPAPPDVTQKITPVESFSATPKRYSASATAPKQKAHKPKAPIEKSSKSNKDKQTRTENKSTPKQVAEDKAVKGLSADLSGLDKSELIETPASAIEQPEIEVSHNKEKETPSPDKKTFYQFPHGIIIACICAVAAVCIICSVAAAFSAAKYNEAIQTISAQQETKAPAYYESSSSSSSSTESSSSSENETAALTAAHTHDWQPVYTTVHHDATYTTVHHDTTYKEVTANHTVCNQCQEECDTEQSRLMHTAHTGHQYFTPNVPITKSVVDKAAYDEQVVDQPAYDEQVLTGYTCSCGETKGLD